MRDEPNLELPRETTMWRLNIATTWRRCRRIRCPSVISPFRTFTNECESIYGTTNGVIRLETDNGIDGGDADGDGEIQGVDAFFTTRRRTRSVIGERTLIWMGVSRTTGICSGAAIMVAYGGYQGETVLKPALNLIRPDGRC